MMPEHSQEQMSEQELPEEKREIIQSAVEFADYLTNKWPQIDTKRVEVSVDNEGTEVKLPDLPEGASHEAMLNYYISGSLSTTLLSKADSFTELDESQMPAIKPRKSVAVPYEAKKAFANFARPMGDLDYVPIAHYKNDPHRLRKGGGGPSFEELPEGALKSLKKGENQVKLMCDPVENYGPQRVAEVKVGNKNYYITRPDTILAYKVLHLLQSFHNKPEKFNNDFPHVLSAVEALYSESELAQLTYEVLCDYEQMSIKYGPKVKGQTEAVLANPNVSSEIRTFLEKVVMLDAKSGKPIMQ